MNPQPRDPDSNRARLADFAFSAWFLVPLVLLLGLIFATALGLR